MSEIEKITELIMPHLEDMGFEPVRIRFTGAGKYKTLQIMAEPKDETKSLSLDDCAEISTRVSALLDVEDFIKGAYQLEVSSPGVDRPLVKEKDFDRFKESLVEIKVKEAIEGKRKFKGRLKGIKNGMILIETENETLEIPYTNMDDAHIEWENPMAPKPKKGKK